MNLIYKLTLLLRLSCRGGLQKLESGLDLTSKQEKRKTLEAQFFTQFFTLSPSRFSPRLVPASPRTLFSEGKQAAEEKTSVWERDSYRVNIPAQQRAYPSVCCTVCPTVCAAGADERRRTYARAMMLRGLPANDSKRFRVCMLSEERPIPLSDWPPWWQ